MIHFLEAEHPALGYTTRAFTTVEALDAAALDLVNDIIAEQNKVLAEEGEPELGVATDWRRGLTEAQVAEEFYHLRADEKLACLAMQVGYSIPSAFRDANTFFGTEADFYVIQRDIELEGPAPVNQSVIDALGHARGALDSCTTQMEQMSGMFDDEDGTIEGAFEDAENSTAELRAVETLLTGQTPHIVVGVHGGRADWAKGDAAYRITIVDGDVDGADEGDLTQVKFWDGETHSCNVYGEDAGIDREFVEQFA